MKTEQARVKNIRKAQIIDGKVPSQELFAESIGVSGATITKIEQGRNQVTLDVAKAICKRYSVSLDYIYGLSNDTNDEASTMLLYLQKLFGYTVDTSHSETIHRITAMQSVTEFLTKYAQATKLYESGEIPEAAYTPWVKKLKSDFNDAFKSEQDTGADYILIEAHDYDQLVAKIKCDLMDETPKPIGGK